MGQPICLNLGGRRRRRQAAVLLQDRDAGLTAANASRTHHRYTRTRPPQAARPHRRLGRRTSTRNRGLDGWRNQRATLPGSFIHDSRRQNSLETNTLRAITRPPKLGAQHVPGGTERRPTSAGGRLVVLVVLESSSRETCFSVTLASSTRKSTTFSSKIGARIAGDRLRILAIVLPDFLLAAREPGGPARRWRA